MKHRKNMSQICAAVMAVSITLGGLLAPMSRVFAAEAVTETDTVLTEEIAETAEETVQLIETETEESEEVSETEEIPDSDESAETEAVTETEEITLMAKGDVIDSGICGDNVTYRVVSNGDDTYTLNISGTGDMFEFINGLWDKYPDSITAVNIGQGVTSIPKYAFQDFSTLTKVIIPGSVTSMWYDTFSGCKGLKSAGPIGSGCNIKFGWKDTIPEYAFGGSLLEKITFPKTITSIGYYAFTNCRLKTVKLPEELTSIGSKAFAGCPLTHITIPDKASLESGVFENCTNLTTAGPVGSGCNIEFSWTDIIPGAFKNANYLTKVTIPQGVTNIQDRAFSGCSNLTKVNIKSDVISIAGSAFHNSPNITIYCSPNSDAVIYAKTNDIPYVTTPVPISDKTGWIRLAGIGRYDTMAAIVKAGFSEKGGTVVVAAGNGFKDALAAVGFAGLYDAPIILTDGKQLSARAKEQLQRLQPQDIYVVGGTAAVSWDVESQIDSITGNYLHRIYGQTSASTSAALAEAGEYYWSDTAIIATNKSFKDALSAAPLSYSLHMPILLADNGKSLNSDVLKALKECEIRKVVIVGGELAVTKNVEKQLINNGINEKRITRIAGKNAVETSAKIAEYGISQGMTINRLGIATSQNYPDALAGAALCGYNNSVLLLADEKAMQNTSFPKKYKADFANGYVFGGTSAVSDKVLKALQAAVK